MDNKRPDTTEGDNVVSFKPKPLIEGVREFDSVEEMRAWAMEQARLHPEKAGQVPPGLGVGNGEQ